MSRIKPGATAPIEAFKTHGEDFVIADDLSDLVAGMNTVGDGPLIDAA